MLVVVGILFVALVIVFIEYPLLKDRIFKKEMYVFLFLLFIGIGLNIINSLHIKFPNLLDWLIIVYKPISKVIFSWLS